MEITFRQINIDDFELCVAARKDAYFCSFGYYDGFDDSELTIEPSHSISAMVGSSCARIPSTMKPTFTNFGYAPNKLFKRDSQRVAFSLYVGFSV